MVVSVPTLVPIVVGRIRPAPSRISSSKSILDTAFGAGYTLGVDGIAVVLVLFNHSADSVAAGGRLNDATDADDLSPQAGGTLSARPAALVIVVRFNAPEAHAHVAWTLAIESMVLMSVIALDVLPFYVLSRPC